MKSTARNLMAGMNVSREQKVGRVNGRAKGLPQDGAHAGGQTYDSSKRRETTSNHQTTSDHDQRLRVPCRMFLLPSMLAHFMRLMGAEAQAGARVFPCTTERIRLAVLGVVAYGICLIDFPWALEAGGGTGVSVVPEMAVERHKGCRFIPIADQGAYRRVGLYSSSSIFVVARARPFSSTCSGVRRQ